MAIETSASAATSAIVGVDRRPDGDCSRLSATTLLGLPLGVFSPPFGGLRPFSDRPGTVCSRHLSALHRAGDEATHVVTLKRDVDDYAGIMAMTAPATRTP